MNEKQLCAIYIRVSTEEQAKHGYSIDSQKEVCASFAQTMGYEVAQVFADEGESAKDLNRPALQELMLFCNKKNNIKAIIVWKLDRLSRNTSDYHAILKPLLMKHDIKLLSVTEGNDESISGDLARNIWISFAEYERKMIALRVNAGMIAKAKKGIYPSTAPIGYKNNKETKTIVLDETKAFFIRRAFELYATGAYTVEKLREQLAEEGFNKDRNTPITKKGVYTILKNPFYMGVFIWKGERYNGTHKPIITPALFYKVQDVFEGKRNPRLQKHDFPYTNLIKCSECGCYLTAEIHKGRLIYYKCTGNRNCPIKTKKYIRQEKIEEAYQDIFDSIQLPEELAEGMALEIKKLYKEYNFNDGLSVEALSKELPKLENKLSMLYEDKLEGIIDNTFFLKKKNEYQTQIEKIKIQIDAKIKAGEERYTFAQDLIELCKSASTLFKGATNLKKRMLINLVQSNAVLKDEKLLVELKPVFYKLAKLAKNDKWYSSGNNIRTLAEHFYNITNKFFEPTILQNLITLRKVV